jgi:hypothetical protein
VRHILFHCLHSDSLLDPLLCLDTSASNGLMGGRATDLDVIGIIIQRSLLVSVISGLLNDGLT